MRLPDRVHITIVEATVAPATEDGGAWDGPGRVPLAVIQGVSQLLATAPARGRVETAAKTGAVLAELAHAAASGIAAPDPRGHADLLVGSASYRRDLAECHDTFRPTWYNASFDNIPLNEGVRLRIQLSDSDDIGSDDPIGTVELNYDDLVAALSTERVAQIRVADQTRGQLLFVGVSVVAR